MWVIDNPSVDIHALLLLLDSTPCPMKMKNHLELLFLDDMWGSVRREKIIESLSRLITGTKCALNDAFYDWRKDAKVEETICSDKKISKKLKNLNIPSVLT
jgi:hypothetical protein